MVTQQEAQSCSLSHPHIFTERFSYVSNRKTSSSNSRLVRFGLLVPPCFTQMIKTQNNWWIIIITHLDICCILSLCVLVGFFVFLFLVFYFVFFQFHRQGMLSKKKLFCFNQSPIKSQFLSSPTLNYVLGGLGRLKVESSEHSKYLRRNM